jgi:hypothetical protein
VAKISVHTTAESVLQLSIVSSSRLGLEHETRARAGKTSLPALGAKYTIVAIYVLEIAMILAISLKESRLFL